MRYYFAQNKLFLKYYDAFQVSFQFYVTSHYCVSPIDNYESAEIIVVDYKFESSVIAAYRFKNPISYTILWTMMIIPSILLILFL